MVEILCPHCQQEIELDDGVSGEFACPHCGGEFEWNIQPEVEQFDEPGSLLLTFVSGFFSGSLLLTGLALFVASMVGFGFSSVLWGAAGEGSTDNLGGIGVVVMMGIAGAGFLLSLAVGFWGLSILLLGIARVLRT
ncbi:MAG: hypothetical protein ACPG34_02525 [Poseidonia sp.]|jgi:hypothetical protein